MKPSYYYFVFPFTGDENRHVMYNARSGAMALIDNDKLCEYESFCSTLNSDTIGDKLKKDLIRGGFIKENLYVQ